MTISARLFKLALSEKLAFIPPPQAVGPGGAPVGPPAPGGMDAMAGPPPGGDPAAAGAPPVDPAAAAGAPPMDPSAGAPPVDPAAGAPPAADPMAGVDPALLAAAAGAPPAGDAPAKDPVDEQVKAKEQLGTGDAMVPLSQLKEFTVGVIEATKGKKTLDAKPAEDKPAAAAPAEPAGQPGPITGLPGLDPSAMQGPLKLGSVIEKIRLQKMAATKKVLFRK